jgi:flagellar hook-basal body complex protein FliE
MITSVASIGTAGSAVSGPAAIVRSADTSGADFGSVLSSLASETRQSLRTGETAAIAGLMGKMPLQQVVSAVMAAEQSLTVAIAVRDKVISAYTEISRMSI